LKFCIFARSINPVGARFNIVGINGDGPEVGLDPRTNGVAHPSVVHSERPDPYAVVAIINPKAPAVRREAEGTESIVSGTRFSFGFSYFPIVAHASKN
jgi:hypothetical protein